VCLVELEVDMFCRCDENTSLLTYLVDQSQVVAAKSSSNDMAVDVS
jgi:hypothetical protein